MGLSLAYDIITKEHGGTIKVESLPAPKESFATGEAGKEGEGAVFVILLPIDIRVSGNFF